MRTICPSNIHHAYNLLQLDLNCVSKWCQENGLKINSNKTQVITIGTAQNRRLLDGNQPNLMLLDQVLDTASEAKNLGIIFDQNLNFLPYLNSVTGRCKRELYAINRIKKFIPRKTLIRTIESTVLSKVYYAPSVIQASPPSYLDQTITRIVNFGAKMVCGLRKYDRATAARKELKWLDAQTHLKFRTQLMGYKLFLERDPIGNFEFQSVRIVVQQEQI